MSDTKISSVEIQVSGMGVSGEILPEEQILRRDLEWEQRLARTANLIRQIFRIQHVFIRLIGADGNWVRMESGTPVHQIRDGKNPCDTTLLSNETILITNAETDPRILSHEILNDVPDLKSYLAHSLQTSSGEAVGVLCAWDTKPREFSADELEMFNDVVYWVQREVIRARELDRASQVQRGLKPTAFIHLPGYEIAGFCRPTQSVGGDFYDWRATKHGAAFTVADVMGKGMGSAIIAATVRAVFRAAAYDHEADRVVQIAAEILEADLTEAGAFVTLIHGRLNVETNTVRYIDAGHGLTLHVSKQGDVTRLATTNFPLGIGFAEKWDIKSLVMYPGDTLLCLSDGMLDIFSGTLEALDEISDVVLAGDTAKEVVSLLERVAQNADVNDDVTALVIRRT
ncbi:MAG: SpoIIE family protein phosphatase [Actinobacteria bacterium]|nr:SpoIIE family protein phosphatase [Actinomycetota bacterium]